MIENRLEKVLRATHTETLEVGQYPSIFISDSKANPTYGHIVNYSYIRCPQFARLGKTEEVFLFESEGLKFAIQGSNIFYLARMINLRLIAEIFSDEPIEFDGHEIGIEAIIVEPMGEESGD